MLLLTSCHGFFVTLVHIIISLVCVISVMSGENDTISIPTTSEQWDGLNFEEHFNISQQPAPPEGHQIVIFDLGSLNLFLLTYCLAYSM